MNHDDRVLADGTMRRPVPYEHQILNPRTDRPRDKELTFVGSVVRGCMHCVRKDDPAQGHQPLAEKKSAYSTLTPVLPLRHV
jgi:hypothetical protein